MEKGFYKKSNMQNVLKNLVSEIDKEISGWTFLHGHCGIFALALHDVYGYEIGWTLNSEIASTNPWNSLLHIFCIKRNSNNENIYIDIRGCQSNRNKFEKEFLFIPEYHYDIPYKQIETYIKRTMSDNLYNKLYESAKIFIKSRKNFYKA